MPIVPQDESEPRLSERELAALAVLAARGDAVSGPVLAARMREAGRATSPAAAHQAGAALARKGLAVKVQPYDHLLVRYEITSTGREVIARHGDAAPQAGQ